jgi:hypothetical protein
MEWFNYLADLETDETDGGMQFPLDVPGFNLLTAAERAQLEADIEAMHRWLNDNQRDDAYRQPTKPPGNRPRSDAKTQEELRALLQKQADQQYLEVVAEARHRAETAGHAFPEGVPRWECLEEAEQNGGIQCRRNSWERKFDKVLAARFEDPSQAKMLRGRRTTA